MPKPLPVYALVGPDPFLQLLKLSEILRDLPPDVQRVDADGERAELAEVLDELRSFAMFGGGKVVVVRDADAFITRFRGQMEEYLSAPSNSGTLVLRMASLPKTQRVYKAIDKVGKVEDCSPPGNLPRWVSDRARSPHKIALDPEAARLLVELVGEDLGRLDNELAKLAIDADETGGKVGPQKVADSVAFQREQEVKEMTIALATGDVPEALRRWRQLVQLDSSAEFRAVTWLGMWLEDVRAALRGGAGKLSWKYKDRFPRFLQTSKQLGEAGAAHALDLLAEVDHQSKTGVGDAAGNVERFILEMGTGVIGGAA
jgi:DNA polymerase III delta subunit